MKKLILLFLATFSLSLFSCRENTKQKTEDAVEAIGKDIEDNVNKAGDNVKKGAKKVKEEAKEVGKEIDKEIYDTDDVKDKSGTSGN